MASSSSIFLMFLCLRLLIIVPLISKGIATPYSQFIGLKVTAPLQCKSLTFLIALSSLALTCAMSSFSLQCLSDVIPVEKNQKVYSLECSGNENYYAKLLRVLWF